LIRSTVDGLGDNFGLGNSGRIQGRTSPSNVGRQTRKVDDATIAAITAQVVRSTHEDAIDRARLDTQRAEHALAVVNRVAGDFESLTAFDFFFANIDAIDGASLGTLVAGDTGGQIEAMKAPIAGRDGDRQLGILKMLGKRLAIGPIGFDRGPQRHPQSENDRVYRLENITKPGENSFEPTDHI